jgi:hypothetical protein
VETPISTLIDLYNHFNMEFDIIAADSLYNHTRIGDVDPKKINYYYSTYRGQDYDIFKWKHELKMDKIREVEDDCAKFMAKVGYKIFEPEVFKNHSGDNDDEINLYA